MKIFLSLLFLNLLFVSSSLKAQSDSITYELDLSTITSTGLNAPFWIQNNQYGVVPFEPNSTTLFAKALKQKTASAKLFDYDFVASSYLNISNKTTIRLHELYLNCRFWVLNASAGMHEEKLGNQDESLSSGGLLFSQNSQPIPKVFIGIEDFTPLFFNNRLLEIKGGISYGWFTDQVFTKDLLFHHKYGCARVGGNGSPIHIQYALDHVAQWGGNVPNIGEQPSGFNDLINVFFARGGSSSATLFEQINVGGNHIISQSIKLELSIKNLEINTYWQNLNEDKPIRVIWNSVNIADGLWGISFKNKKFPIFQKVLYEYLNTTDQSGPFHDIDGVIYGGGDSYFNNYLYQNGWTHYGRTIGTPFITSPVYNTSREVEILNNRVQLHHVGMEGAHKGYNYKMLCSFSNNYGTYLNYPIESRLTSTNMFFEIKKHFEKLWKIDAGMSVGVDLGKMYTNNIGIMLKIGKKGNLFTLSKK